MSKTKTNKQAEPTTSNATPETTNNTQPEVPVSPTPETESTEIAVIPSATAGMVPAAGTGEAPDVPLSAIVRKYIDVLPEWQQYLEQVAPPQLGEVDSAVQGLPEGKRKAFLAAVARMNPVKLGQHTARREFTLPDVRVYHGTGNDEMRPPECPPGGIYSTDGRLLAATPETLPNLKFNPKYTALSTALRGYVISIHDAATFWPPRNGALPEGVDTPPNVPICRSLDRKRGDYFGACAACAWRPFKDGKVNKDACRNEDHVYFVPADFSGIYRIIFSGTSIKPGSAAIKKKSRPWDAYFSAMFDLEAKVRTEGSNRWFELTASVSAGAPEPTPEEIALLSVLTRQIDYEVFFPRLHTTYTTPPKAQAQGSSTDMDALLNRVSGGGAKKDVSGNNL